MEPNDLIKERYRLVKPLGSGSFGQVWLANDTELGIDVAIKIYIALDSKGLEEFKQEFKNSRNLNHPNLLRADHYDVEGNNPYLVMNYCPESLGNQLGGLDERGLWKMISEVSAGLSYLHEMNIIHRDIKPDNVLINEHGDYVISDFGLSKKMRSTLRRASARSTGGTAANSSGSLAYMAPEMFSASPEAVKESDVWAFAATIYEVATGELPFLGQGGVMELGGAQIPNLPAPYSKELNDLMRRAMSLEKDERPTAEEIHEIASAHVEKHHGNHHTPKINVGNDTILEEVGNETLLDENGNGGTVPPPIPIMPPVPEDLTDDDDTTTTDDVVAPALPLVEKKRNAFKVLFYILLGVFVVSIGGMMCWCYELEEDNDYLRYKSSSLTSTLRKIKSIVNKEGGISPSTFKPWTSTNHSDNSTSSHSYLANVYEGDYFMFNYETDCEDSYDKLQVFISYDNEPETKLREYSGQGKSGTMSYKATRSGALKVRCVYHKDGSYSKGSDKVKVFDVKHQPSQVGAVKREIINSPFNYTL